MKKPSLKIAEWAPMAEKRLTQVLRKASAAPELRHPADIGWHADVRLVAEPAMKRLNARYRGKNYATDVLSFPAPEVFRAQGRLGELVICLPTLARQADERGHRPEDELHVLIVHGVLHLLGMDHERGRKHAAEMAKWEARLLPPRLRGLIERSR